MTPQIEAAFEVQQFFSERVWKFCIIGGLAVQRWSEPRQTRDADATLFTSFGSEEKYIDEILKSFAPRHEGAREFALRQRVLLLQNAAGVPIDIALGGLPFEERAIDRSSLWRLDDEHQLRTCSAEDLIVYKAFAARGIDWFDVQGVIMRHGATLNRELIFRELTPLAQLKEQPEIVEHLRELIEKFA